MPAMPSRATVPPSIRHLRFVRRARRAAMVSALGLVVAWIAAVAVAAWCGCGGGWLS